MNGILAATLMVGGTGLLIGILLGIAGKKFYVEVDERETKVREALPGNNCGGCGYPGCDGAAAAVVKGEAPISVCRRFSGCGSDRCHYGTGSRSTGAQKSSGTVRRYV